MSRFWSEHTQQLAPYIPGEQPKNKSLIKLNTNENPFPPSAQVLAEIKAVVNDNLRLYPDPEAAKLKQTVADYYGLQPDQVFAGNGSDEVLAHAFAAFFQGKTALLMPDISYGFYPVYCRLYNVQPRIIPLNQQYMIDPAEYTGAGAGVIFPNPNAPTGLLLSLAQIEVILQANPDSVVLIDEAYIDFGGESAVSLIPHYPNLLVVQTLSKSRSLAGMRIGLALGQPELIEGLNRVKDSFNSYPLDQAAQAAAMAAFNDESYFRQVCEQIKSNRRELIQSLEALGFVVLPSAANFVLAQHPKHDAQALYQALHQAGIIVRHFQQHRINQFLRISIGTQLQQKQLIETLISLM